MKNLPHIVTLGSLLLLAACSGASAPDAAPLPEAVARADDRLLQGDEAEALRLLDEVATGDPRSFHARYRLGFLLLYADPAEARVRLEEAEHLAPAHPGPPFLRALLATASGNRAAAVPLFGRAATLRAARIARRYALQDTSDAARRGLAAMGERRFAEARADFAEAVAATPDNPVLRFLFAEALHRTGDPRGAIEAAEEALRRRPDFPDARALLGISCLILNRREEARDAGTRALAAEPRLPAALHLAGLLQLADSEYRQGFLHLWHAILEDPAVHDSYQELGSQLIVFGARETGSRILQVMEATLAPRPRATRPAPPPR